MNKYTGDGSVPLIVDEIEEYNINIATINVQGMGTDETYIRKQQKLQLQVDLIKEKNNITLDIVHLTEIRNITLEQLNNLLKNYSVLHHNDPLLKDKLLACGNSTLIHKDIYDHWKVLSFSKCCHLTINLITNRTYIFSYIPPHTTS